MQAQIRVSGSRVTIDSAAATISFWSDTDFPADLDATFALWAMLPIAMRTGENLRIDAPLDATALVNANRLARIWALWMPELFSIIDVEAAETLTVHPGTRENNLHLYSGGVDSTYALLAAERKPTHTLTVHGLDYASDQPDAFAHLMKKTEPLVTRLGCERVALRTDIYKYSRKITSITHGFCLAACAFLFQHRFNSAVLAADRNWAQDLKAFPWGTNHVTNPLFASNTFRLHTASSDKTRTQKLAYLAADPDACRCLSFCQDKASRPHNCGVCSKCLRTKAMFLAATGAIPPIFKDNRLAPNLLADIDLRKRNEWVFFADLYTTARDTGHLDAVPGLAPLMEHYIKRKRATGIAAKLPSRFLKKASWL